MMDSSTMMAFVFWASLLSLDITAFGPFLLTQPIVCGPLFGLLVGDIPTGLMVGGVIQLIWMDGCPIGVGIPFETTIVTFLTIGWSYSVSGAIPAAIACAFLLAIPFGYLFTLMDSGSRKLNQLVLKRVEHVPDEWLSSAVSLTVLAGIGVTFLRYFLLYAAALVFGGILYRHLWQLVQMQDTLLQGATNIAYLLPVVGLGVALEFFLSEDKSFFRWPFHWPKSHSEEKK